MTRIETLKLVGCLLAVVSVCAHAQPESENVEIKTWETATDGVFLSLTQILPDQARAFYVNRGFPLEATEEYATSCVYMTVLRNDTAKGVIRFRLADWSVSVAGEERSLVSVSDWLEKLHAYNLNQSALVAFRWAQFPPEQEYQPGGDWNQGMLSAGLPPGARFDLIARWTTANQTFEGVLRDVECAR